jgi:hypothetical protein
MLRKNGASEKTVMNQRDTIFRLLLVAAAIALPARVAAQTDYYNTDAGRPIRIEDAYPVERRAFELQLAPLRLERSAGAYTWGVEPEAAFGILPRTHLELGFPLALIDAPSRGTSSGLAGVELSAMHNLNVETAIPALAIVADVLLPAGGFGPDRAYPSLKGIATKTFSWMRFHANGQYTFGNSSGGEPASGAVHVSRWMAGLAADKTFPLRSLLLTAEIVAEQPLEAAESVEWSTAAGVRYQWSPRWAMDAGFGVRLGAEPRPWFITMGSAYAFGLPWYPRR